LLDLTVIIACKNRKENLDYCLRSISGGSILPKVYIVDFGNKTPIKTPYKWVKVIRVTNNTEKFHKARAVNIGLKQVKTKYACVTDADQIFSKNFFSTVVRALEENSKRFIMCKTYALQGIPKTVQPESVFEKYGVLLKLAKKTRDAYGDGCCHATLASWFRRTGGYEESFLGWGYEDSDMAWRARKLGLTLYSINRHVSMIHLPHPIETQVGGYRHKHVERTNKVRYAKRRQRGILVGNVGRKWGIL